MTDQKELVWLPADIAATFTALEGKTAEDYILAAYELRRKDIEQVTSSLEDDILSFKAKGIAYKRAFQEAFEGEKVALDDLFAKAEADLSAARRNAAALSNSVRTLTQDVLQQVKAVNEALRSLDAWRVTETVEKLTALQAVLSAVTPKTQQVLRLLLEPTNED